MDWHSNFTYSLNRNKVVKLLKPTMLANELTISQDHLDLVNLGNVKSMITEGGSMGDLYVTCLQTDFHGYINVDYVNNTVAIDHNAGHITMVTSMPATHKLNTAWAGETRSAGTASVWASLSAHA